jgi:tripartite-type tricarboxylate transporter receptor subunit TctC
MEYGYPVLTRRHLIALCTAALFQPVLFVRGTRAQAPPADFPNRIVRFIVPTSAGGPTDLVGRMLAENLSKIWRQQVVVENRAGAGTNIGNEYVARADPDGYTVLFATAALAVNASIYRSLNYDPIADFAPVSLVSQLPFFMFVPNTLSAHSVMELIALAKAHPGKLRMASPGTGSAPHLAAALFMRMAEIEMTQVPYRGAAPALTDLMAGRVDCYFGSAALLSYVRSGQLRGLATTGTKRHPTAPELPTMQEAGIPGYEVMGWQALFVPAKTPPDIVRKISADTNAALAEPTFKHKLATSGYVTGGSSPEELEKLLKSDITKWSAVIKSIGIKID